MSSNLDNAIGGLSAALEALNAMRDESTARQNAVPFRRPPGEPLPLPSQDEYLDQDEPQPFSDDPAVLITSAKTPSMAVAALVGFLIENPGHYIIAQGDRLTFGYAGMELDRDTAKQRTQGKGNQAWGPDGGSV